MLCLPNCATLGLQRLQLSPHDSKKQKGHGAACFASSRVSLLSLRLHFLHVVLLIFSLRFEAFPTSFPFCIARSWLHVLVGLWSFCRSVIDSSTFYIAYTAMLHRRLHMHVERPETYTPLPNSIYPISTHSPSSLTSTTTTLPIITVLMIRTV